MVFPGGSREVAKRRGEKYKLIWKKRIGFARLAIKHGCTIQPFSAVGIEDMFKLVFDANDYKKTPLKHIQEALKIRDDILHPICKGAGPFGLPRLERLYFSMGNPIETRSYNGDFSVENCWDLRKKTMSEIEQGIDYLQRLQMNDPHRDFFSRMAGYFYK